MEIRISKYDPELYVDGVYIGDEWTEVGDIGTFPRLTKKNYLEIENKYWTITKSILDDSSIKFLRIFDVEWHSFSSEKADALHLCLESYDICLETRLSQGLIVSVADLEHLFKAALRGVVFFKALGRDGFYVHVSSNFYLFIGAYFTFEWKSVEGLFVTEGIRSPYHFDPEF